MNEYQLRVACDTVARVVLDALHGSERPTADDLKKRAEDAAEAICAGFAKLPATQDF